MHACSYQQKSCLIVGFISSNSQYLFVEAPCTRYIKCFKLFIEVEVSRQERLIEIYAYLDIILCNSIYFDLAID
jgi:hypothetical protein